MSTPGRSVDYRRLFDALPSPYLLLTADLTIVTVNAAYARATMIDADAVVGRHLFEVFPDNPDNPDADGVRNLHRSLRTVVETGQADAMALQRYDVRAPDGRFVERYWSPVNTPVLDDGGRVALIAHRVQDVTELVTLRHSAELQTRVEQMEADLFARAQELQDTNRQLREANAALAAAGAELHAQQQAKDRFIATLSHELRNPLASTRAALDVLALDAPDHPARAVLDRQLTTLTRITDDLLTTSSTVTGRLRAVREPLDLRTVVLAVLDDLSGERPEAVLPPDPVVVDGDAVRLRQMLTNLLDNARTHAGDEAAITLAARGGWAEFRVQDAGHGFDPESATILFDPFVRTTAGDAPAGLGLGLAVVRGIAEAHDGTVTAHSDGPGTGATFTVCLPLSGQPAPTTTRHTTRPALRVLLVDDNHDLADMCAVLLAQRGDEVTVVTSGEQALAEALRTPFDLVLCDLALGEGIDGHEVARRLRRAHRHMPLVAVSGFNQTADRDRSRAAGFDAHLAKPLNLTELDRLLHERSFRPGQPK